MVPSNRRMLTQAWISTRPVAFAVLEVGGGFLFWVPRSVSSRSSTRAGRLRTSIDRNPSALDQRRGLFGGLFSCLWSSKLGRSVRFSRKTRKSKIVPVGVLIVVEPNSRRAGEKRPSTAIAWIGAMTVGKDLLDSIDG